MKTISKNLEYLYNNLELFMPAPLIKKIKNKKDNNDFNNNNLRNNLNECEKDYHFNLAELMKKEDEKDNLIINDNLDNCKINFNSFNKNSDLGKFSNTSN